jgi:hypothetical protein
MKTKTKSGADWKIPGRLKSSRFSPLGAPVLTSSLLKT